MCGHGFGATLDNDLATLVAGVGAEFNNPVGALDDVQMVLDDNHGVSGVDQPVQDLDEHPDVIEMEPGGGFVEKVQLAAASLG
jgi:hypothetical protein